MKNFSLSFAFLLLFSLTAFSQVEKGPIVIVSAGSNNLSRPQRLLITVSGQAGYMGDVLGLTAVYNNTVNLYKGSKVPHENPEGKASSVGLKLYGKVFKVDALHFFLTMEADKHIDRVDKYIKGDFAYKPGASVAVNFFKKFDAMAGYEVDIYQQGNKTVNWRYKQGGKISIAKRF